jgi:hypothetical protein
VARTDADTLLMRWLTYDGPTQLMISLQMQHCTDADIRSSWLPFCRSLLHTMLTCMWVSSSEGHCSSCGRRADFCRNGTVHTAAGGRNAAMRSPCPDLCWLGLARTLI